MSEHNHIELVDEAFAGFRTSVAPSVPGVDPDAVHNIVTRRRRARTTVFSVLAILAIAVPIAIYSAVTNGDQGLPPIPAESGAPTPPPTSAPPSVGPPDVRDTTLTLPDPQFVDACGKGGKLTFVDGVATVGAATGQATWTIGEMTPIEGDLDGVPGAELVTTIRCSLDSSVQLVALRAALSGELSALGYVIPPGTDLMFDAANVRIEAGVVQVTTTGAEGHTGPRCYPKQVRGYSYRDGLFKQTSGPTKFPDAPLDVHQIDLRNAALALSVPGPTPGTFHLVCVSMNDGTGTGMLRVDSSTAPVIYTFTIEPHSFATGSLRDFGIALVTYRAGGGPEVQSVQAIHRATDSFEGQILLYTGVDGVSSIDGVRVNDNRVIVTVTVNGTKRAWTYYERPGSDVWARA